MFREKSEITNPKSHPLTHTHTYLHKQTISLHLIQFLFQFNHFSLLSFCFLSFFLPFLFVDLSLWLQIERKKNTRDAINCWLQSTTRHSLSDRINADILLSGRHQHQRDLFTGSMSIPTHVETVIHAFETMARKSSPTPVAMQSFEMQATGASQTLHHHHQSHQQHQQHQQLQLQQQQQQHRQHHRKSLSTTVDLYQRPQQSVEHRHSVFDVPPAPPPPVLNAMNSMLAHRSLSSPSVSEMMATENMTTTIPCEYHARTLSHAHAANKLSSTHYSDVRQHMPTTITMRGSTVDRVGGRSDADGSSDAVLRHSQRLTTFDAARNVGTNTGGSRNIGAAVSVANISFNMHQPSRPNNNNNNNSNNFTSNDALLDSIDTNDDYRKNIFGLHPTAESKELRASTSSAGPPKPKINYNGGVSGGGGGGSGAGKIPRPVSQTILRNDSNNNAHKSQETKRQPPMPSTNIYLVRSDNGNYLQASGDNNWNAVEDDQTFLRGSTVSQSFIKNMKNAASSSSMTRSQAATNQPTNTTGAAASKKLSSLVERSTRSYYKPQKYILSDESQSQDELRARYTEHGGDGSQTMRTRNKSPPRIFRPAKHSGFGYTRQK